MDLPPSIFVIVTDDHAYCPHCGASFDLLKEDPEYVLGPTLCACGKCGMPSMLENAKMRVLTEDDLADEPPAIRAMIADLLRERPTENEGILEVAERHRLAWETDTNPDKGEWIVGS